MMQHISREMNGKEQGQVGKQKVAKSVSNIKQAVDTEVKTKLI